MQYPRPFNARRRTACQRRLQPANALARVALPLPETAQAASKAEQVLGAGSIGSAPGERRAQVVVLQLQSVQPLLLVLALHSVAPLLSQAQVPITMSRPRGIGFPGLEELLLGVLPDGLEEAIAHVSHVVGRRLDHHD